MNGVVQGILERHHRYGVSSQDGEWGAIQAGPRTTYLKALEGGNSPTLERILGSMFQDPVTAGLVSVNPLTLVPDHWIAWVRANVRLWSLYTGETDISMFEAPVTGSPTTFGMGMTRFLFDGPRHDCYAVTIGRMLQEGTVLEIGSGYGGLALQLRRRRPDLKLVLCDLPETLYLAWYWLSQSQTGSIAWYDEADGADITLLPNTAVETWDGHPDLVFAAHSLSEMPAGEVSRYLRMIERWGSHFFLHDSAAEVLPPEDNPTSTFTAFPEQLASSMVPQGYGEVYSMRRNWHGSGERYWEFLYERVGDAA